MDGGRKGGKDSKKKKKERKPGQENSSIEQLRQISGSWASQTKAIDNISFLQLLSYLRPVLSNGQSL